MNNKPWYTTGIALGVGADNCTCCGKKLSTENNAVRMLELDQRTDTFHDFRDVPADKSQGWFPFGLTCARKAIKNETERRATRY